MSYDVKKIDLGAVVDEANPRTLVEGGKRVGEIIIGTVQPGASFRFRIGNSNPFFDVDNQISFEPVGDDESNAGIFFANPVAQAGVFVQIIIVFGDGRKNQLNAVL